MRHCKKNSCWWQIRRREISSAPPPAKAHQNWTKKRTNRLLLAVNDVVDISEMLELACQIYRDCECAAWCFSDHNREEHLSVNSNFKAGICPLWLILFHDPTLLFPTLFFLLFLCLPTPFCPLVLFKYSTYCIAFFPFALFSHLCFNGTVFFHLHCSHIICLLRIAWGVWLHLPWVLNLLPCN